MIELNVCICKTCRMNGSYNVIQSFQQLTEENMLHDSIEISADHCTHDNIGTDVIVSVNGKQYNIKPENAGTFFKTEIMPMAEVTANYTVINFGVHPVSAE